MTGPGLLIVEDHQPTADLLNNLLAAEFPGYAVRVANSGEAALDECHLAMPRVVIMDLSLPGMNGIEATRRIRAVAPSVQVIVHSSHSPDDYAEEAAKAGASACIRKAGTLANLISAIAVALSADPPGAPSPN